MYPMNHEIVFNNNVRKYKLKLLNSVEITSSVENLVDVATIVLPESVMNTPLELESKIERGTEVVIKLGYTELKTEFIGYVTDIVNKNGTLVINCEDALFLFRKTVPNKIFKPAPVKDVLQYLIDQVNPSYKLMMDVDYGVVYEKFIIHDAEAYDVLKKIQEDLKANIFFNTQNKELHFHAPYKEEAGKVTYDMSVNVEESNLEYKKAANRKYEVIVQSTATNGTIKEESVGVTGGEKITVKVGAMSNEDMRKVAETILKQRNSDRYEGTIKTWLLPYVAPSYRAKFIDSDYEERNGNYYITSVVTSFSSSGGVRTLTFGIRL